VLIILSLLAACTSLPEPAEEGPEGQAIEAQAPSMDSLVIATRPDAEPIRVAPVRPSGPLSGEVVVRDCYGNDLRLAEKRQREKDAWADGSGGPPPAKQSPPSPTPRAKPSPRPAPAPVRAPAAPSAGPRGGEAELRRTQEEVSLDDVSGVGGGAPPVDVPPSPDPAPAEAAPTPERAADKAAKGDGDLGGRGKRENEELKKLGYVATEADALGDDEVTEAEQGVAAQARRVLDWGATVYLSNDDSMSLASAQRTLYALKHKVRMSVSEVRPHELLNYFSFDVAPVPEGQLFSVLGAAQQDGDTLSVSLAVRGANPERQPLDLTLALDRSCSMRQDGRMDYTKRGLSQLAGNLQDGDRVDVVLFDSKVCTPLENFVVGRDDPSLLELTISQLSPKGSTDLDGGLREAYRIQGGRDAQEVAKRNKRVVLITDAELNTGNVDEDLVSEVGKQFDAHDVRLTGIGVGRTFNDDMLDKLTEKGKGAYVYLGSEAVVDRVFGPGFDSLTRTIAHDVQFSLELPDSLAMERFYGEESSTVASDVQPIHYYAGTTQLFLQDLAVRGGSLQLSDPLRMRIRYTDAATGEPGEQVLHTTLGALVDGDTHNLRKGQALIAFADVATAWAMGASPCGGPLATYRQRVASLLDDAEIGYTNGLVGDLCGVDLAEVVQPGVAYKVNVDSDMPIAEVSLSCAGQEHRSRLSAADTVARFPDVTPGQCTVQLQGTVPMMAAVDVPVTGGDVRCVVRGGRLSCG